MPSLRGIIEGVVGSAVFLGLSALISRFDVAVPVWVLFAGVVLAAGAGFFVGRLIPRSGDLAGYHADHFGEMMLTLRELLGGTLLGVTFEEFIERGVLAPARFGLSRVPGEDIRLSVLALDETQQEFRMLYEAGHRPGRKHDFRLSMTTLAGHAYRSRELQWTNDIDKDQRWTRHEKARPDRAYGSLAAVPVIVGDDLVAILNVLSTKKGAFFRGDLTYIELLATVIGVAWTVRPTDEAISTVSS